MFRPTYSTEIPYRTQVGRYVVTRVLAVLLAGLVVRVWGLSQPYPINNLAWFAHTISAVAALVYGGIALYVAGLADDGHVDDPHIRVRYALIAPATLSHEFIHASAARVLGGEVHGLSNDGGVFTIAVDVPADRPRWARAVVDVAPTLVGLPLVVTIGALVAPSLVAPAPTAPSTPFFDLMAVVAFIYAQVFAIPSGADLQSAWATLSGRRDRERLDVAVWSED